MSKPVVMECETLTVRYRVSLHNGRMQIELFDDGAWRRILFDRESDVAALVDTIDTVREIVARAAVKGRARA